jgi:hypothetical protein
MSTIKDIEQRLRSARPEVEASPPPFAAVLAQIEQAAGAAEPKPRRWWRRTRTVIPVALAAVVLAGAGGGALLLAPGKPLAPAFVLPANPNTSLGQPVPASLVLLPMRVADPAGGPPWGMRVIRTTRGLVCLQAGRVVDGQLGGLGIGYAFDADRRFHPFLPADAIGVDGCVTGDANGLAFMPEAPVIVTADGLPLAGENLWPDERVHCDLPGQQDWGVRCPQTQLRQVALGLLGPDARSIRVSAAGRQFTLKPYGPEGAYLVVLRAQPNANTSMQSGSFDGDGYASRAPHGAVLTVTYNDGSQCQIPGRQRCPREGFDFAGSALPSSGEVSAPVDVRYLPLVSHPTAPLIANARSTNPLSSRRFLGRTRTGPKGLGEEGPGPALAISFRARVSAQNESSGYVVQLMPQEVAGCATPALIVSQPTEQTISAGQHVEMTVPLEDSCTTSYSGRVFFAKASSQSEPGVSHGEDEGPLYEVIGSQFGARPHSLRFPTVGSFRISVP